jgi:hypothetical protein
MKNYIFMMARAFVIALIVLTPAATILASDITNADFYGTITVSNNSSTTRSNTATVISGANSSALIAGGYLISTANNCAIQYSGADVVFMPGFNVDPWVVYTATIGPNTNLLDVFYTKGVSGGQIRYFPGPTGMSVASSPSLNIQGSGNYTASILFNPTSTDDLLYVPGAVRLTGTGAGTVAASVLGTGAGGTTFPTIASSSNNTGAGVTNLTVTMPAGYAAGDLIIALVSLAAGGPPAITPPAGWTQLYNCTPSAAMRSGAWYKVADGAEGGSVTFVAGAAASYSSVAVRINLGTYTGVPVAGVAEIGGGAPDPPSLTSGFGAVDTLWLACVDSDAAQAGWSAGYNLVGNAGNAGYRSYMAKRNATAATENPGAWATASAHGSDTIAIKGFGVVATVTSGAIAAGEHVFQAYKTGADWGLKIDSNVAVTTAYATNISAATGPIIWCEGTIATYVEDLKVYKAGALTGYWYWEYGATFTDHSGNGNTATPSFRTTSSDAIVSAILSSFYPSHEDKAPSFVVGIGPNFLSENITISGNFTAGNVSLAYPGSAIIQQLVDQTGVPYQIPSTFIATFLIIVLSMATSYFLKSNAGVSLFVKSTVNTAGYGIAVALHIYDWWQLFFFFIFEVSFWFAAAERKNV